MGDLSQVMPILHPYIGGARGTGHGADWAIVDKPLPADDPRQRQPDITLARERLGWSPRIPLDQGLEPTIEYFRKLLDSAADGAG